jgi:hypothetical protein
MVVDSTMMSYPQQHEPEVVATTLTLSPSPSPGELLHQAMARNDLYTCRQILACPATGPTAATHKNFRGSTPLMLAADGKCGKKMSLVLVDLLLNAGADTSAAQKSRNGRTAADMAAARGALSLADKLRCLEQPAEEKEEFGRCVHCKGKLRKRSKLAFLKDRVGRNEEQNSLVLNLFSGGDRNTPNAVIEGLDRMEFHRVNSCVNFRKELTESMALIEELRHLRRDDAASALLNDNSTYTYSKADSGVLHSETGHESDWSDWHVIDLCSGSSLTGALILHLLPGCFVTAVDIAERDNLPHFSEAGFGGGDGMDKDTSQFSYVQGDVHDPCLIPRLCNRTKVCATAAAPAAIPVTGETNDNDGTAANAATTSSRPKVVVFAMHCCGALSLRAVDIFRAMDARAAFLMPCCLPPKSLGGASCVNQQRDTHDTATNAPLIDKKLDIDVASTRKDIKNNAPGSTSFSNIDLLSWRGIEEEISCMYTSRNPDEQHRRWAKLLKRYAEVQGADTSDDHNTECKATNRDIPAVLSARRTLISIMRATPIAKDQG